jgi:hypothetical protein
VPASEPCRARAGTQPERRHRGAHVRWAEVRCIADGQQQAARGAPIAGHLDAVGDAGPAPEDRVGGHPARVVRAAHRLEASQPAAAIDRDRGVVPALERVHGEPAGGLGREREPDRGPRAAVARRVGLASLDGGATGVELHGCREADLLCGTERIIAGSPGEDRRRAERTDRQHGRHRAHHHPQPASLRVPPTRARHPRGPHPWHSIHHVARPDDRPCGDDSATTERRIGGTAVRSGAAGSHRPVPRGGLAPGGCRSARRPTRVGWGPDGAAPPWSGAVKGGARRHRKPCPGSARRPGPPGTPLISLTPAVSCGWLTNVPPPMTQAYEQSGVPPRSQSVVGTPIETKGWGPSEVAVGGPRVPLAASCFVHPAVRRPLIRP